MFILSIFTFFSICGMENCTFWLNIKSEGLTLVIGWSKLLKEKIYFQCFFPGKAVWETLFKDCLNLSTWLSFFSWNHKDLFLLCLRSLEAKYSRSLEHVEGGSLSDIILFGIPCELKNRSIAKITFLPEVLLINSAVGYVMRWSIIINIYWIFVNEPKKIRLMVPNVAKGVGWYNNLCRSCDRPNTCVIILSLFRRKTSDLLCALIFVRPKCPAWVTFTPVFS